MPSAQRDAGRVWRDRLAALADDRLRDLDGALGGTGILAVVLDGRGRIAACTDAWRTAAASRGLDPAAVGVGVDYLAVCDADDDPSARTAGAAIRAVLRNEQRGFSMDYECSTADERRWFTMRVAQLVGPASGALVTHVDITPVRAAELAIRGELHELWQVVDPHADFVFLLDAQGRVLGRTRDESQPQQWPLIGEAALDFVHPDDALGLARGIAAVVDGRGNGESIGFRARAPADRAWRHFTANAVDLHRDPTVGGIVVAVFDVTATVRSASAHALAVALSDETSVTAVATDEAEIITAMNSGAEAMLGVPASAAVGTPLLDHVMPVSDLAAAELREAIVTGGEWAGELDIRRRDGGVLSVSLRVRALDDPVTGFQARSYLAIDHSEERRLQSSLWQRENEDSLTGLPNAAAFAGHLGERRRTLQAGEQAVVAELRLDRFTELNSLHGRAVGDAALRAVASALTGAAGADGVVARHYGDVFSVVMAAGTDPTAMAERLLEAIDVVHPHNGPALRLSASIGIRVLSADDDPATVLDDAALAAEAAKRSRSAVQLYDDALRRELDEAATLRRDLPAAITSGDLEVHFQPVVRLDDGVIAGAEALVRWRHPTLGVIDPEHLVALAEESGTIHELGAHVLDVACRHAARWRDLRPELPCTVAVNVSAAQLGDASFADRLRATLARHAVSPSAITIELTETMLMTELESGRSSLAPLKATGVRLAVDDFGTGYSSLGRLRDLPLDLFKLDRTFVDGMADHPHDAAVVKTVVSLGDALGLDVVGEGVERPEDAAALRSAGCRFGQGYLWSPAVPAPDFECLLRRAPELSW